MDLSSGYVLILFIFSIGLIFVSSRYKRCPADKIFVIYNHFGDKSSKCVHGGGVFVWPIIQDYGILSLDPMVVKINIWGIPTKELARISIDAKYTIAISTNPKVMQNAAERLLFSDEYKIIDIAKDIIVAQIRLLVASKTFEEIKNDDEEFKVGLCDTAENELNKLGLSVINILVENVQITENR